MNELRTWTDIPTELQVALILLAVIQLGVQITAVVSILRTPVERLLTGKRWLWLLVVLAGGLVGAIVYRAIGRLPPQAQDPMRSQEVNGPTPDRGKRAAELLYGESEEPREADNQENRT